MTLVGARPQFVKAALFSRAVAAHPELEEILVHSGQHYDGNMSDVFFAEMALPAPDHHLGIGSASHAGQTARIMEALDALVETEEPDWLVVFGDTNTTLAGALVASKRGTKLCHIEAGLRSFNRAMPEEINRQVTDVLSDRLYAPSDVAVANLEAEGVAADKIVRCGDIMYDAVLAFREAALQSGLPLELPGQYALLTLHRQENVDDRERLTSIIETLEGVSVELPVICPLHPRTAKTLEGFGLRDRWNACVTTLEPVGYLNMLRLQAESAVVLTDSGGVQKEAFFLGVPCCTLRTETEWTELVDLGWNTLVDVNDPEVATSTVLNRLCQGGAEGEPYGDGNTAEFIVKDLAQCAE